MIEPKHSTTTTQCNSFATIIIILDLHANYRYNLIIYNRKVDCIEIICFLK